MGSNLNFLDYNKLVFFRPKSLKHFPIRTLSKLLAKLDSLEQNAIGGLLDLAGAATDWAVWLHEPVALLALPSG